MNNKKFLVCLSPVFRPFTPPLSLAMLSCFLKQHNISVDIFDANIFFYNQVSKQLQTKWLKSRDMDFENESFDLLKDFYPEIFSRFVNRLLNYDIIGFSCFQSNLKFTLKTIHYIKQKNNQIKILLGGPEISSLYFKYKKKLTSFLNADIESFIIGEGEIPLLKYFSLKRQQLYLFDEASSLNDFPLPDFSQFDLNEYPGTKRISLLFSRGCIKKCKFCAERLLYRNHRTYPVNRIITQMKHLKSKKIDHFIFHDSLLNGELSMLEELCDQIICHSGEIKWEAQMAIRPEMSDNLFKKIKKSGCSHLFIGLESGSDSTLSAMNKGYSSKEAVLFFKKLNQYKISFGISLIIGFPGETDETFKESLDFIVQNKNIISRIEQINPFIYYNGIPIPEKNDFRYSNLYQKRIRTFVKKIKKTKIKHKNAYILNLISSKQKSILIRD